MKWLSLVKSPMGVCIINPSEGGKMKAAIRYNPLQHSLRLISADIQRVFFIEPGFRYNHFIFKNEYGFETGRIHFDAMSYKDAGIIEFEQANIQFAVLYNPALELVMYEPDGFTPLAVCELQQEDNKQTIFSSATKETIFSHAYILWSICWYLFATTGKEIIPYKKGGLSPAGDKMQ